VTAGGGSSEQWEALINFQSSSLTEIKNLMGETRRTLRFAQWTLFVAVLTLLAAVVVPLIVK